MTSSDDPPQGVADADRARSHPEALPVPVGQPEGNYLSEDDAAALGDVRWHWGQAYEINCSAGTWTARYVDDTSALTATSEPALRTLIRHDYVERRADELGALRAKIEAENTAIGRGEFALRRLADEGVI